MHSRPKPSYTPDWAVDTDPDNADEYDSTEESPAPNDQPDSED